MIKILLIPSSDYLGHPFPQRHNQIFERLNATEGFEVHVVRFNLFDKVRLKTNLKVHTFEDSPQRSLAMYYLTNALAQATEIRKLVKQEGIDVIVLSNLAAPFAYTLINQISSLNIPIIVDLPDYYPASAAGNVFDITTFQGIILSASFDFILRRMIRKSDLVTVVSQALKIYARRAGAKNVEIIPNGISEDFFKNRHKSERIREKLGFDKTDFLVGYVGSVEFWLEMQPLFRGLVSFNLKHKQPAKLLLVGRSLHTSFGSKVRDQLKEEALEQYVTWVDFVPYDEVPFYISALNVGTIPFNPTNPTAYYSSPNKIWEYLSQNKPVASTAIPEALCNAGFLSIVNTADDYSAVFSQVYSNNESLLEKAAQGYAESKNRTWDKSAERLAQLIRGLVRAANRSSKLGKNRI